MQAYIYFTNLWQNHRKDIFNHLYSFFAIIDLISESQSGFRPGDSTTYQMLHIIDIIHRSFNACPILEVSAIFMDICKTFDKVWHGG